MAPKNPLNSGKFIVYFFFVFSFAFSSHTKGSQHSADCSQIRTEYMTRASELLEEIQSIYKTINRKRQSIDVNLDLRSWLEVAEYYEPEIDNLQTKRDEVVKRGQSEFSACIRIANRSKIVEQIERDPRLISIRSFNLESSIKSSNENLSAAKKTADKAFMAWSTEAAKFSVFGPNLGNLSFARRVFSAGSSLNSFQKILDDRDNSFLDIVSAPKIFSDNIYNSGTIREFVSESGLSFISSIYEDLFTRLDEDFLSVDSAYSSNRNKFLREANAMHIRFNSHPVQSSFYNLKEMSSLASLTDQIIYTGRDSFYANPVKEVARAKQREKIQRSVVSPVQYSKPIKKNSAVPQCVPGPANLFDGYWHSGRYVPPRSRNGAPYEHGYIRNTDGSIYISECN